MNRNNKERVISGVHYIKNNKIALLVPIIYIFALSMITYEGTKFLRLLKEPYTLPLFKYLFLIFMFEIILIGIVALLVQLGTPKGSKSHMEEIRKAGFKDDNGNAPLLISESKIKNGTVYEFFSSTIPYYKYEKYRPEIETALNAKVVSIEPERDMQHVLVKAFLCNGESKEIILWDDKYIDNEDFSLVLGQSISGDVKVDLNLMPHLLIGGGTGSGKTVLLKLILWQCMRKNAIVYIADFKGGVDFPEIWHKSCTIVLEKNNFLTVITKVRKIMKDRQNLFVKEGVRDIVEYIEKTGESISRIIIACDEVGELFNKANLSKEEKELSAEIEVVMESLASLGRAFGIHLILSTQRPSADVIDGKIKGNLPMKICGRAESTLSKIILDDTEASRVISQKDRGMFLTNTKEMFKAYYFDETNMGG